MDQFTKCAALDLASKKIRVNSVNPALIRTPFRDHLGLTPEENAKLVQDLTEKYPLSRVGEVDDTSAAIAYLADDKRASRF